MVSLPMGADQQLNAARLDNLGLGVSLRADSADVGQVREALAEVLASTRIMQRLNTIAGEIASSPGPAEAIRAVEALVP